MSRWLFGAFLWLFVLPAHAGTATLTWSAPTQRTDGSALTDLAGYRVYERCGAAQYGPPLSVPAAQTQLVREGLPDGVTCYWQLSAVDAAGIESARTAEVSKTFPALPLELPGAPGSLVIEWRAQAAPPTGPPRMAEQTGSITGLNDSASPGSVSVSVPSDATLAILTITGYIGTANRLRDGTYTLGGETLIPINDACTDHVITHEQGATFYLVNPPTGTQTLSVAWTGTPSEGLRFDILFFRNVDTADPIRGAYRALDNQSGNATYSLSSIVADAEDYTLGVYHNYGAYGTMSGTGSSQLLQSNFANAYKTIRGGNGVTGFSMTQGNYSSTTAIVIRAAPSGPAPVTLTVGDSVHLHAVNSVAVVQDGIVAAFDGVHTHTADSPETTAQGPPATQAEIISVAEVVIGTGADPAAVDVTIPEGTTAAYFVGYNYLNATPAGWDTATLNGEPPDEAFALNNQWTRPSGDSGNLVLWAWYEPAAGTRALDVLMLASSLNGPLGFLICTRYGNIEALRDAGLNNGNTNQAVAVTVDTEPDDVVIAVDCRFEVTASAPPANQSGWGSQFVESNINLHGRVRSLVATGTSVTANSQNVSFSGLVAFSIAPGAGNPAQTLTPGEVVHAHATDATQLSQDQNLSPGDAVHALASDAPAVEYASPDPLGDWLAALAQVSANSANATILCVGDSTTAGDGATGNGMANNARSGSWPVRLAELFPSVKASAANFLGSNDADDSTTLANYDNRLTLSSGWALDGSVDVLSADLFYRASGSNALLFAPGVEFDRVELFYRIGASDSTFAVNVDGGASLGTTSNAATPPPYYGRQTFITETSQDFGSVNYALGTGATYDHGRLTQLPEGFGDGEFTLELWVRASNVETIGQTSTGAGVYTNWANENGQPYSGSDWWYYGNFLIDGHNNSTLESGTFSLQVFNSGRIRWTFGDGAAAGARVGDLHGIQSSGGISILDGEWHKIVCVRRWDEGTGCILELYVDGQLQASETSTARTNMASAFWDDWADMADAGAGQEGWFFGAEKIAALGGADWADFKGLVTSVAFWNVARSEADLTTGWQAPLAGNEAGLVGLYRHDEGTGTTVADALASGGTIALVDGPTWSADAPFPTVEGVNAVVRILANGTSGRLHGARVWRSDQSEVSVINAGWWGGTTVQAASGANTGSLNGLRNIAPDLTVVFLGINDIWSAGTSEANYRQALRDIIDAARESGSVLLVKPHYIGTGPNQTTQANFYANVDTVAAEYSPAIPVLDLAARWGTYAQADAAGFMDPDAVHITELGYYDIAAAILGQIVDEAVLVPVDAAHSHRSDGAALIQASTVAALSSAHAQAADPAGLTQANTVSAASAAHQHASDSASLTQAHVLAATSSAHQHVADGASLTQASIAQAAGAAHVQAADDVVLSQAAPLAVDDSVHAQFVSGVDLLQAALLEVAGSIHAQAAAGVILTQAISLAAQSSSHAHLAEGLNLTQRQVLAALSAVHGHIATQPGLSSGAFVQVGDSAHAQFADSATLVQAHYLEVGSAAHVLASAQVALTPEFVIQVAEAVHALASDGPQLSAGAALAVASSAHLHLAGMVDLTQATTVIVSDAVHAQIAATISLIRPGEVTGADLFVVSAEGRLFIVAPEERLYRVQ